MKSYNQLISRNAKAPVAIPIFCSTLCQGLGPGEKAVYFGRKAGLVVMGGDLCSEGSGFKSEIDIFSQ